MQPWYPKRLIALAGQGGAGKDTAYDMVLQPRGYLRCQMTLHDKVFLVSTSRFTWDDVYDGKSTPCRKVLQEEITGLPRSGRSTSGWKPSSTRCGPCTRLSAWTPVTWRSPTAVPDRDEGCQGDRRQSPAHRGR
jgi:hypothetical protein